MDIIAWSANALSYDAMEMKMDDREMDNNSF